MPIVIKHPFVSTTPDAPTHPEWVRPSNWNADHDVDLSNLSHAELQDIGSNTHAQIDTHLALVNEHIDWTDASADFETSGEATAKKFNGWGIVPIGGVVAWLKSFTGTPSLPSGYAECNGQVLNDSDSIYNGQTLPSLNNQDRFLRGKTTSGGIGGSPSHKHNFIAYRVGITEGLSYFYFPASNSTYYVTIYPKYYDVVYVMRTK